MFINIFKNPINKKRFLRFKKIKRAYISLIILIILYIISLGAELICNSKPLYIKYNNRSFFPVFRFYPESRFTDNNKKTRPNYKNINKSSAFQNNPGNYMIFPPLSSDPYETINPDSITVSDKVLVTLTPVPVMGTVNIRKDYSITKCTSFKTFINKEKNRIKGIIITDYFTFSEKIKTALKSRFNNQKSDYITFKTKGINGKNIEISLSEYSPRKKPPQTIRLTFKEIYKDKKSIIKLSFQKTKTDEIINLNPETIKQNNIPDDCKTQIIQLTKKRFSEPVDPIIFLIKGKNHIARFDKKDLRFPYPPVSGHIMGIDSAGRDVAARILYGMRLSLTFGLLLVICSMTAGIAAGAIQGYYGGITDITGQRFTEIWSALPFLYIMILMGSIYGRSFLLLLFCYGIFNWIGISYYTRAEFFRLRKEPFVEAAKCMGISSPKIIYRHILPNALVPAITFFPFSLVSAIGSLAALDYLGFGLPPPAPSWGELLFQAQQYRWAWWLILYPSAALFIVMLCGVFIGEGLRSAYDPKQYSRFA